MEIIIKSHNGLGDLLFVTPTLRVLKEAYPDSKITVNTNHPILLHHNPFVDKIGTINEGVFLGYADPIHCVNPTKHHIIADWEIVTKHYGLTTRVPDLKPEIYLSRISKKAVQTQIGVQIEHKGHWYSKKVWPFFSELLVKVSFSGKGIRSIPHFSTIGELVRFINNLSLVVCAEGGIQHIAKAVGTPAIVIYGGFAKPEWNGYEDQVNIVNPKPCSYCYNPHECVAEIERECMREITVEQVVKEIENIII